MSTGSTEHAGAGSSGPQNAGKSLASTELISVLEKKLIGLIEEFTKKRNTSRLATNLMTAAAIVIGGVVTVLVGVRSILGQGNHADAISVVTLVLSPSSRFRGFFDAASVVNQRVSRKGLHYRRWRGTVAVAIRGGGCGGNWSLSCWIRSLSSGSGCV